MTKFFGPARSIIHFLTLGPFGPVWARLDARQNQLSLMFYTKTTNTTEIIMLIGFGNPLASCEKILSYVVHLLNTHTFTSYNNLLFP